MAKSGGGGKGGGRGKSGDRPSSPGASGRGERELRVRVKTARGRKISSTLWLDRQLNDPYVRAARRDGYRARAAYKLIEIDEKRQILKPGQRIVDLGAAPGGWTQVAVARVNALGEDTSKPKGSVLGVDLQEMEAISGSELMLLDFLEEGADVKVKAALGGAVDVVLSDMAAKASGHKQTDHLRIILLVEAAAQFAREVLKPGGTFVAKVLQGGADQQLLTQLKKDFDKTYHMKPPASRSDSAEQFLVATGFRGAPPDENEDDGEPA